jgi:serine protease Do
MIKKCTSLLVLFMVFVWTAPAGAAFGLPDFTDLARDAGKAVVNISTVKHSEGPSNQDFRRFFGDQKEGPLGDFFEQFERFFGDRMQPREQRSLGSGFIISEDGYIVTNNHVIEGADEVRVNLQGGNGAGDSFEAELVGADKETDLALLKIVAEEKLPVLRFGDSEELEVGQWVMAIGNPFGLDHTVTAGIISAKGRTIGAGPYDNFLQTDASINPGNSGGPLLNLDGEVIGINTAIIATGQGIGFAIPSSMAKEVISQLKNYKKVRRGWIGVTIQDVDENTATALGLDAPKGALVAGVQPGDPADKGGVQTGDVIIAVDGSTIEDASDLTRKIGGLLPGTTLKLTVWRKGRVMKLEVVLEERNMERLARSQGTPEATTSAFLGLDVRPLTREEAGALGMDGPTGLLIVEMGEDSLAGQHGVRPGDLILEANGRPVASVAEFEEILEKDARDKGVLMLLLKRQGQAMFRTIPLEK